LQVDQARRLKELEQENAKLKRLVVKNSYPPAVLITPIGVSGHAKPTPPVLVSGG
jgi:hypothetical protein